MLLATQCSGTELEKVMTDSKNHGNGRDKSKHSSLKKLFQTCMSFFLLSTKDILMNAGNQTVSY